MKKTEKITIRISESNFEFILQIAQSKKISKSAAIEFIINKYMELQNFEFINPIEEKLEQLQTNIQSEFFKLRSLTNKAREYAEASWLMGGYLMNEMRDVETAKTYRDTALSRAKKGE